MPEAEESASTQNSSPLFESLTFTLRANTGEILKFESVDAAGGRRELSKPEIIGLAKEIKGHGVEALLERAFEAGIACLLDGDDEKEEGGETQDENGLRKILLEPLIEGSDAARVMRREVLRQAIVQTLIRDVASSAERRDN